MARNKTGGRKQKKGKNSTTPNTTRQLEYADENEVYGYVKKLLGDSRVLAACSDGAEHVCRIRGKMRKRVYIKVGDVVLIAMRDDTSGEKGDIFHKYNADEIRILKREGELVDMDVGDINEVESKEETGIEFGGEEGDEENNIAPQPDRNYDRIDYLEGIEVDEDVALDDL